MSATLIMHLAIPNKPIKSLSSKKSKFCFASYIPSANGLKIEPCASIQCNAQVCDQSPTVDRRSGNYEPPLWDFDFVQSLSTAKYAEERYSKRANELIKQVKKMLVGEQIMEPIHQLELIDDLHSLGISYHFDDEIDVILNSVYHQLFNGNDKYYHQRDLYSTSLGFRLLRQHGFSVSQGVFDGFKNEKGEFKESLGDDTKGLLQLYEASFLMTQGEKTLELAREYSTSLLHKKLDERIDDNDDDVLVLMIRRALELPVHWRIQRPNARWFIEEYSNERRSQIMKNPILLELAKLDFNIVQATHQQELKHVSSWWEQTGLAKTLPFARDRLVECYLWTIGGLFEPQYGYSRIMSTKVNAFITVIDDIFDVYGTLEELLLFNDVIQRWDIEAVDKLPHYMQMCFLALNNFVDELAYNVLKQQGFLIIPHLRKSWANLCKAYLQEAKWYSKGYTPTLEEYINNAWISISAPVMLSHEYFLVANPIDNEAVQSLYEYHNIVRCSAMVLRLSNDLGTSPDEMKRGDVPKSVQCYMNETGGDTEDAQTYIRTVIYETWKKMNEERVAADSLFQKDFVRSAVDLGRMAQYMYQHGDGHGIHFPEMKDRISSLLFEPFSVDMH
uniref:Limonene-myrcene synthase n=1 Tax=Erythranthe lewisii TaxID=69919 RepID=W6A2K5_ERYLE|nr:limonene-myrcene synthase [Erythranthe lewisii]AHI50309.2 limonene-myrcene synthase [Erythranthe lewisii]